MQAPSLFLLPPAVLAGATVLDVLHLVTGQPSFAVFAWQLIAAGLLLGVAVAAVEWLDRLFGEPAGRASARDAGIGFVLVLFGISWVLRLGQAGFQPTWAALLAGWAGVLAWLAAEIAGRRTQAALKTS